MTNNEVAASAGVSPEGVNLAAFGISGALSNLSAATLGNIVGGAIVVGGIYWLAYKSEA